VFGATPAKYLVPVSTVGIDTSLIIRNCYSHHIMQEKRGKRSETPNTIAALHKPEVQFKERDCICRYE